jgi:hypothetical protein
VRSAAAPAAPPRRAAPSRPLTVAPRPRRVSGPERRGGEHRRAPGRARERRGVALGLLAVLESLPRRLPIGARTWIGLVAFALIGIVTLQLGLLKLNAGIGRALEHEALLQRENAALSIENSELAASGRVTSQAAGLGMELVPAGALRFLRARPGTDAPLAAAGLRTPLHAPGASPAATPGAGASAGSSGAAEQPATGSGAASASGESSGAGTATTAPPAQPSATTTPAAESPAAAPSEAARPSGGSTSGSGAASSSTSEPSSSSPPPGGPGGGTQAGPSG